VFVIVSVTGALFVISFGNWPSKFISVALTICTFGWFDNPVLCSTVTSWKFSIPTAFNKGVLSKKTFLRKVSVPSPPSSKIPSISP